MPIKIANYLWLQQSQTLEETYYSSFPKPIYFFYSIPNTSFIPIEERVTHPSLKDLVFAADEDHYRAPQLVTLQSVRDCGESNLKWFSYKAAKYLWGPGNIAKKGWKYCQNQRANTLWDGIFFPWCFSFVSRYGLSTLPWLSWNSP